MPRQTYTRELPVGWDTVYSQGFCPGPRLDGRLRCLRLPLDPLPMSALCQLAKVRRCLDSGVQLASDLSDCEQLREFLQLQKYLLALAHSKTPSSHRHLDRPRDLLPALSPPLTPVNDKPRHFFYERAAFSL